jgi:hypothetical protein
MKPMELSLIWSHILRECLSSLLSVCVGVHSEKCKYIYVHIQGLWTIPVSVLMTLGFGI